MKAYRNGTVYSWLLLLLLNHLCLWMNVQAASLPFKAVNLGGWLVTEGWITPSLFKDITNPDLLDGTKVQFWSTRWKKYLCADENQASKIVADRESASDWETFKLWRVADDQFHFRASNRRFVGLDVGGGPSSPLVALEPASDESETFQIIRKPDHKEGGACLVYVKAMSNGMYLQATSEDMVTADFDGELGWEEGNEAVFLMSFVGDRLQGEFQVTNGLGLQATQVMHDHWNSFINEDDFAFIANHGLNAVRIPVGWWTAKSPPPAPFVEGSLDVLDMAFTWAEKYKLSVILDLHAPPYSENGMDHSGTRDGTIEFGSTQESIDETVGIIEFFSERYKNYPSLAAVELINEPEASNVSVDILNRYYEAGYAAVRRHLPMAYVIMSRRHGTNKLTEIFDFANGHDGTVIDVHYYNLYEPKFNNMDVMEKIQYVYDTRAHELEELNSASPDNKLLTFVGEWTAQLDVRNAGNEDYQKFAKAQLEVYRQATFGWAYWTFKTETDQPWSLQWMINNGLFTV